MAKPIVLALCVIFFIATSAQGQTNPFLSATQEDQNPEDNIDGVKRQLKPLFPGVQRDLNSRLSTLMRRLEEEGSVHLWFFILGVAFLYGIIHALGPGHRKTVIFSYFLSEDATVIQGIASGFLLAILHAGASVAIISLLYFVFKTALMTTFENINLIIQRISAGLLALIGIIMLSIKIRTLFRSRKQEKKNSRNLSRTNNSRRSLIPVIVASGIIPCPGAAMILILALTMGSFTIGVIAVASMSLGMAVTVSAVAVVTIVGKERILHFIEKKATLRKWLHEGVETAGALILVLFAVLLYFSYN